jgi:hypothetical protein
MKKVMKMASERGIRLFSADHVQDFAEAARALRSVTHGDKAPPIPGGFQELVRAYAEGDIAWFTDVFRGGTIVINGQTFYVPCFSDRVWSSSGVEFLSTALKPWAEYMAQTRSKTKRGNGSTPWTRLSPWEKSVLNLRRYLVHMLTGPRKFMDLAGAWTVPTVTATATFDPRLVFDPSRYSDLWNVYKDLGWISGSLEFRCHKVLVPRGCGIEPGSWTLFMRFPTLSECSIIPVMVVGYSNGPIITVGDNFRCAGLDFDGDTVYLFVGRLWNDIAIDLWKEDPLRFQTNEPICELGDPPVFKPAFDYSFEVTPLANREERLHHTLNQIAGKVLVGPATRLVEVIEEMILQHCAAVGHRVSREEWLEVRELGRVIIQAAISSKHGTENLYEELRKWMAGKADVPPDLLIPRLAKGLRFYMMLPKPTRRENLPWLFRAIQTGLSDEEAWKVTDIMDLIRPGPTLAEDYYGRVLPKLYQAYWERKDWNNQNDAASA